MFTGIIETIGIIKQVIPQGDLTNFHFSDNLARTIHHEGVILVELIPLIYDTERTEQILREDGNHEVVTLKPAEGDDDPMTSTSGDIKKAFDLSSGRYGVTISAGANYTTRRQENFQAFTSLLKGMPALGNLAPDLIISQMDIPIAKEISDRMVLGLPPAVQQAIQAKKQGKPMDPQTMQLMAHAQQQQMLIQQLTQGLSVMQQKVASKEMETQAKIQTALIQARAAIIAARERAEADRQDNVMTAYFEQALTHIDRQYDLLENSQQAALAPPQGAAGPTGAPSPAGQPASPQTAGASSPGGM